MRRRSKPQAAAQLSKPLSQVPSAKKRKLEPEAVSADKLSGDSRKVIEPKAPAVSAAPLASTATKTAVTPASPAPKAPTEAKPKAVLLKCGIQVTHSHSFILTSASAPLFIPHSQDSSL